MLRTTALGFLTTLEDVGQENITVSVASLKDLMRHLEALRALSEEKLEEIEERYPEADSLYCAASDLEYEIEQEAINAKNLAKILEMV